MKCCPTSREFAPLAQRERQIVLDVLRGVALFGVLWSNLLNDFRVSLFEHLVVFHTHTGAVNELVDLGSAWLIESKAFTVFAFLFGVGACIQTSRASARGMAVSRFMARRFSILLGIGLIHILLIWNGDILCMYAVCGFMLIPLVKLPTKLLVGLALIMIAFAFMPFMDGIVPGDGAMKAHAAKSTPVYAHGTFREILALRWRETWGFMLPLLISSLPKTLGLMVLGIAAGRSGVFEKPASHRRFFAVFFIVATTTGAVATSLIFWSAITGKALPLSPRVVNFLSFIPLALGLASGITLWLSYSRKWLMVDLLAAFGQTALSNYLLQSIIFSVIFYGFGFQLFGQIPPSQAALIGISVFAAQLLTSRIWLHYYRFGPVEWLWRSLTYGAWQAMNLDSEIETTKGTK